MRNKRNSKRGSRYLGVFESEVVVAENVVGVGGAIGASSASSVPSLSSSSNLPSSLSESSVPSSFGMGEVRLAATPIARLRGLMAMPDYRGMLVIAPCRDIHTFGMNAPIDVAFLDERGRVLRAERGVRPRRRRACRGAFAVVERRGPSAREWFCEGDEVRLVPACAKDEEEAQNAAWVAKGEQR